MLFRFALCPVFSIYLELQDTLSIHFLALIFKYFICFRYVYFIHVSGKLCKARYYLRSKPRMIMKMKELKFFYTYKVSILKQCIIEIPM